MIVKTELERWERQEAKSRPELLEAMRSVHTPHTTQGAGLLVSGLEDGAIIHLKDRNGTIHHIQLNAHLALLLAKDLIESGMVRDWIGERLTIRTGPQP